MTPLHAIALAGPDRTVPTIAELAAKPGMATPVIVAPGGSVDRDLIRRVGEHLHLGAVVLLLFQDPAEASAFEAKLAGRARATGSKVRAPCAPGVSTRGAPRPVHLSGGTV